MRTVIRTAIAAGVLLIATHAPAATIVQSQCVRTPGAVTCSTYIGRPYYAQPDARIIYVNPEPLTDADAMRHAEWELNCKPRIRVDSLGVGRYVYARKGCEYGVAQ